MAGRSQKGKEKVHYVASTTFTIDRKYADLKLVGKGSYGVVCSAVDTDTGNKIAIKKITPMAKDIMDAKHVLREIRLMRHMGKHENIISLEDIMIREAADELYIVMELLDSDLHRVIQSPQILTASHHRHFIHQLLCGVKYLHDNRIIHRDLKPGNLLVTRDCRLRITDFGLARERPTGHGSDPDDNIDEPMTEHVVTRWYRPPELMLCPDGLYTYAVDMWSVGCILAEMMARRPIFPGKNFIDQLTLIFDVIGSPQPDEVSHIQNSQAKKYLASQKGKRTIPAERIFPESSRDFHDILNGLLVFEPRKRLTVDECLRAHLFANVSPSASSVYPPVSSSFEFSFEKSKTTKDKLKQLIVGEGVSIQRENLARKRLLAKRENGSNDSRQDIDGPADDDDDRSRASNSTAGRSLGTTRTDGTTKPSQKPTAVPRYATTTATRGYAQPRHASTGRSGMRRTGGDVAGPPGKISTGSRGNLGATAGLSAGAESQRKTESNMRDRRTSDPTARRGTDATDASNGYPPPPVLPTRPSNHPAAGGVAATVTTAATNAKAGQEDMYGSPVRRKPVVVKQAVSPSSPLGASEYPIVAMDSPSRRNKGAMRELEDAECSNKAMQYMSKMSELSPSRNPGKKKGSSGVGIAHEEEKYDRGRVTAVKASSGTATSVGIGVEDDDDLIVRMKRLYGISIHDSKHTGVSSTQATCQIPAPAVTGSNVRVIARRTENTPDSPPPARGVSASEPPVGYHCNTYDSDPDEEEDDDEYDLQAARRLLASNTTRPTSAVRPSVPVVASGKRMDSDSRPLVGSKHIDDYDVSEDNGMDRSLNRAVGSTAQAKDEPSRNAPATATLSAATGVGAGAKELAHSGVVTSGYRSTAAAAARFGGNDDDDDSDDGEDNDDLTGGGYREAEAKSKAAGVCEREKTMPGQSTHTTSTGKTHRVKRKDLEDKPWRVNSTLMYNSGNGRGGNEEQTRTRQRDVESQGLDAVAAVRNMYMVSGRHTSIGEAGQDDDSDKQVIGDMRGERREKTQQAGASQSQVPGKKGLTVPKSPQFSKMSWQRRRHGRGHEGEPPGIPPAATGTYHQHQQQGQMKRKKSEEQLGGTARAGSAPRGKKISTMEHSAVGGGDGGVATSHRGGAAGGGRVDKRSASSGRMGGSSSRAGLY